MDFEQHGRATAPRMPSLQLPVLLIILGFQGVASRMALPMVGVNPLGGNGDWRKTGWPPTTRSPPPAPRLHQHQKHAAGVGSNHKTSANGDSVILRNINPSSNQRRPSLFVRFGAQSRLAARLLGDFTAAAVASLMVSPFISIVDRAIIQSASGTLSMSASVRQGLRVMITKPVHFVARPDFLCTFGLYGATYLVANAISTVASEMARSDTWPRFFGTTAINMPGSIAKDQALTKLFGVVGGATKVPLASFALFTVRDLATMAAAFTLPSPMSAKMQEEFGVESDWADSMSQLVSPGLVQFFSTPVHILGLDLYNHPSSSMSERFKVLQQAFAPAIVLRVARIGVAFGVGGLGNTAIRKGLHSAVASRNT